MRDYAIHVTGAIIFDEDFDPIKTIAAVANECGAVFSERTNTALRLGEFNARAAVEICGELGLQYNAETIISYDDISEDILSYKMEWFDDESHLLDTDEIRAEYITGVEAEFRYAAPDAESDNLENCLMFVIDSPYPWDINSYTGPRSKEQAVMLIEKAASSMLKDGIDWCEHLGELIGTYFG